MRELLDLLRTKVTGVQVQLMFRSAIGAEVDGVAMPHRKGVSPFRVWQIEAGVVLEVVDGNSLRQTAGIALPLAEVAEDHVVSDLGAVGGVREQTALVHRKGLGKASFHAHR